MMKSKTQLYTILVSSALLLSACGGMSGSVERGPVGIGGNVQSLKGTPCACVEIEMLVPADFVSHMS